MLPLEPEVDVLLPASSMDSRRASLSCASSSRRLWSTLMMRVLLLFLLWKKDIQGVGSVCVFEEVGNGYRSLCQLETAIDLFAEVRQHTRLQCQTWGTTFDAFTPLVGRYAAGFFWRRWCVGGLANRQTCMDAMSKSVSSERAFDVLLEVFTWLSSF